MSGHLRSIAALVVLVVLGVSTTLLAQEAPRRGIVQIAPGLYRAQNNIHYTVFLVTPEGIIMSDPINRDFAAWLKSEFTTRFNTPVRYVLYTHSHWDHASGGSVFADTAQFVAQANMPEALTLPAGDLPLPASMRARDTNANGRLDRREAPADMHETFALTDANGDGALSGAELARGALNDVVPPTITYSDRYTVTLGGRSVVMYSTGEAHAADSSVLHFPAERAIFAVDTLQARRFPREIFPTVGAWLNALRAMESLDFDIAVTGHGLNGTKRDVTELREYLEDLARGVSAGIAAGRSLPQIQASLTFAKYREWERYETLPATHIAQVYATVMGGR